MSQNLPFKSHVQTVQIGDLSLKLRLIDSLDDAIEFYAETAPEDADLIPYYTMLWDAAKALAEHLVANPEHCRNKRVLEFGCGLGLPSMIAARMGARVTATDYHPHNEPYLLENLRMNRLENVRYVRSDWRRPAIEGVFDVLLGSDLIYEEAMIDPLVSCVDRYCAPEGVFLFADPGRDHLQTVCSALEQRGFQHDLHPCDDIYVFEFSRR